MRYLLINFIVIVCISGVSSKAMSTALHPIAKSARFDPRSWTILEKALWGKVYGKTTYGSRKLSKLWDREAIGTPEARQLLASLEFPYHPSEVRIFDEGFASDEYKEFLLSMQARESLRLADIYSLNTSEVGQKPTTTLDTFSSISISMRQLPPDYSDHGVLVAHLLAGKSPLPGISTRGKISLLSDVNPLTNNAGRQYLKLPGVINLSKDTFTTDVDALTPLGEKTLFVTAAGNFFPEKSNNVILASRALEQGGQAKIIPVGAINPDGTVSEYSVADSSVVVTAPGEYVFSFDGDEETLFRRTSAAAPAVSGVLADVRSILPQLTQDNAVQLLESTAIKTVTNEVSELNGAGVVNHYKMVRVALRLAEDGYDGELMPDNLDAYLDFSQEVTDLIDTSKNAIEFFLNLRHAFFLDPNNDVIRLQLADAYRQMGLVPQATFYDLPAEAVKSKSVKTKLDQRALQVEEKLADHFSSSPIDRKIIPKIVNSIVDSMDNTSPKQYLLRLAEDDDAFEQLLKTIDAETNMIETIVTNERLPILTNAQIREQLLEKGFPIVEANVPLYLKKLELDDVSERKARAIQATLSNFFQSSVSDKNLTDKEIANHLTGITTKQVQVYKHDKLEEVAQKILQDSVQQQIKDQLLAQEGIFINEQTIVNYLYKYLGSTIENIVAKEPYSTYSDEQISDLLYYDEDIRISTNIILAIRRFLGIQDADHRKAVKIELLLKGTVEKVIAGEKHIGLIMTAKLLQLYQKRQEL